MINRYRSFFGWAGLLAVLLLLATSARGAPRSPQASTAIYLPRLTHPAPAIVATMRWSDPTTWPDQQLPPAGADVVIPADKHVLLDISPPPLNSLTIDGSLVFDRQDLALTSGWIMVHGALIVGSAQQPFTNQATITLTASDPNASVMGMGTRGILVMGGRLELFGSPPAVAWSKLSANAAAAATSLTLKDSVDWHSGDQLIIAPTDFYGIAATEQLTATAANGASVTLAAPLQAPRWGQLQYISASGPTLTPDSTVTPLVVDERAEVGNLTRNIVVQGPDDALWQSQGFGAQVIAMLGSELRIDGVELRRMGQAQHIGRYPIHFHGLSYRTDGTIYGDVDNLFVRNSTIANSANRCIVLHATTGVRLSNNICYNITGHAIFLEDAIERHNIIEDNLVLKVRNPAPGQALLVHESDVFSGGSSGFWITHPDNVLRGNAAADAQGNGFWYAFPEQPLGLYKQVAIPAPLHTQFGAFYDNVTHSNRGIGFQLDWVPINDAGEITPASYRPTADGTDPNNVAFDASLPYTITNLMTYKNLGGALWHREGGGTMYKVVAADNPGRAFAGSANCIIRDSLSLGNSLNAANPLTAANPPAGMASYHSSCDVKDHLFVNLPFVDGKASGVLDTSDFYIRPVDKGLFRDTNLRFIEANFGYRQPPITAENWTLAGALWDPYGYVGPAGNYWTFDDPFLTGSAACQPVAPSGQNGMSCPGPYYGVTSFELDQQSGQFLAPIEITRNDNGAIWAVGDGHLAPKLGNMRHFAMRQGGSYTLRFPGEPLPHELIFRVENLLSDSDTAVLAVSFDGALTPLVYGTTSPNVQLAADWQPGNPNYQYKRDLSAVGSLAEVVNGDGGQFWQDAANNLVWIKVKGGLPQTQWSDSTPGSDDDLYRPMSYRIYSAP